MAPRLTPATSAMATGARPTTRDTRPPQRSRLKRSRPRSSVPSRCPGAAIGARRMAASTASGSHGARMGARIDTTAIKPTTTTPPIAPASLNSRSPAPARRRGWRLTDTRPLELAVANAWVEVGVQQVHYEVDRHEARRHHQGRALHQRHIAQRDAPIQLEADAGPREDRLSDDRAAEQRAHLQAHYRQH